MDAEEKRDAADRWTAGLGEADRRGIGGKIEGMDRLRPGRGRYVVNAKGEVAQFDAQGSPARVVLPAPDGVICDPSEPVAMGPTRIGELLLVDVRVAKLVPPGSRLFETCRDLVERGHCGVVESTLVIDLLEVSTNDRHYLLNTANWPTPR